MKNDEKVAIKVDAARILGELDHSWRYIGYDECNYTQTPEGAELLGKFGRLEDAPYHVRTHHLFCTGNRHGVYKWGSTNIYREDEQGNPIYLWETVDEIIDVLLGKKCKPFFELGFTPLALVRPELFEGKNEWERYGCYRDKLWAYPPKDYTKWYGLVFELVRHCLDRYGKNEVLTWYWELWNEPDIFYWRGSCEDFLKLYDYTEAAVHAALKDARLGGPSTTGPLPGNNALVFLERFLKHCAGGVNYFSGGTGTRLDFVTFHAKGGGFPFDLNPPKSTPSIKSFTAQVETGLTAIKKHGFDDREAVLSEADPDGWAAGGIYDNSNLNFRNTEYYPSFVAAAYQLVNKLAQSINMTVRPLAWAFMFAGERCFEGTRTFSTQGIDKAIFNLFRLYARMGRHEVFLESSGARPPHGDDNGASEDPLVTGTAAANEDGSIQVLVSSHHDDWDLKRDTAVEVEIVNFAGEKAIIRHYRIDDKHSNAYQEWLKQGKPKYPDRRQYEAIKSKDGLEFLEPEKTVSLENGKIHLTFRMPAHAVSLLELIKTRG